MIKIVFVILLSYTCVVSSEIQRVDDMIKDISKLRSKYEECRENKTTRVSFNRSIKTENELILYEKLLKDEKNKNKILTAKINSLMKKNEKIKKVKPRKVKKNKPIIKTKIVEVVKVVKVLQKPVPQNPFPKLIKKAN